MAKLVINPTSAAKKEIPLASRVISIGRDPSNDLVLSDSMVSRRHAFLEQRDNQYILRDNGSSNGTLVNGDRVEDEKPLRDGDLVAIGSSRLLFQLDDTAEASLPRPPEPARSSAPAPARAPETERCPYCGKTGVSGDRFCRGCGRDLTRDKKSVRCEKCGAEVQLPADFCGQCGGPLLAIEKPDSGKFSTRPHRRSDFDIELKKAPADETPIPAHDKPRHRSGPVPVAPAKKAAASMEAAGFGVRLLAFLVDDMILGIPLLLAGLLFLAPAISRGTSLPAFGWSVALAVYWVLWALYFVIFWGARGATPGKSLLGLVVTTETGETPIGLARALLRLVGYFVSFALLGLGFLPILLSEDRRGLHDRIAGTRVARTS